MSWNAFFPLDQYTLYRFVLKLAQTTSEKDIIAIHLDYFWIERKKNPTFDRKT